MTSNADSPDGHGRAAASGGSLTMTVPIDGMTCRACEQRVSSALSALPGVESVRVSAPKGQALLRGQRLPDRSAVDAAIREAGYRPQAPSWFVRDRAAWLTVAGRASSRRWSSR